MAISLAWLLLAGSAEAEPSAEDRALATALFHEGRSLMAAERTAEACPKLEESHRLDPSGGTILNLALCHENQGLLARSWSEFHEASAFARRDARGDREEVAEAHIRLLEPRLSRLTIVVPESARVAGLRIERNGRDLGPASWSTAMPVDGGEHVVRASAPGRAPFATTIVIGNESDSRTIELPPLAAVRVVVASPSKPAEVSATKARLPKEHEAGAGAQRALAWTLGGAGLVQWGVAGYFGVKAFRRHAESNSECPAERCSAEGVALNEQSERAADASTALSLTGLACITTGVWLLLTTKESARAARSDGASATFTFSRGGSTLGVSGRF